MLSYSYGNSDWLIAVAGHAWVVQRKFVECDWQSWHMMPSSGAVMSLQHAARFGDHDLKYFAFA